MVQVLLSVASLLIGVALLLLGNGVLATLIAVRMAIEGFGPAAIGLVASFYFAGLMTGALLAGRVVERVGHIRAFATLAAIASATILLMALAVDVVLWAAMRAVMGFCLAGLFMVAESWLNERASNETRGQVFAIYMIATYLALGAGQLLLNLAPPEGIELFLVAAMLISLSLVPVALTRAIVPAPIAHARFGLRRLLRISPLGVAGSCASGMITGAFYGLAPLFAHRVGLGSAGVSILMALTILGGLILQWPVGRVSDRYDRRSVLVAVTAGTVAVSILLYWSAAGPLALLLVLAVLYGGLSFAIYPLSVAHANDFVDASDLVPTSAGLLLAYALGATVGPITASSFIALAGAPGLFLHAAAIAALLAGFALWRMSRRAAVPTAEQVPFVALTRMSPVAAELDPRGEREVPTADEAR